MRAVARIASLSAANETIRPIAHVGLSIVGAKGRNEGGEDVTWWSERASWRDLQPKINKSRVYQCLAGVDFDADVS